MFSPRFLRARVQDAKETGQTAAHGVVRFGTYAGLGVVVGLAVVLLESVSALTLLDRLLEAPPLVQAILPGLGLTVAALVLRLGWRTNAATSDLYVRAFHTGEELEGRRLLPKLGAAAATIGAGGAVGLEGPSIYAGASLGQWLGRRQLASLGQRSPRILLVAGAAAGVAAVFKAPATGVLFALESPYRRDVARHALIPALVASAAAYLVFAFALGTDPLLPIRSPDLGLTSELSAAILLGVLGGVTARGLAMLFHWAKSQHANFSLPVRIGIAGLVLAGALWASLALVDEPVTLGPGAETVTRIVLDPHLSVWVVIALFGLRAVATTATLSAGGVGGVFIPLVVQGLLLGRVVEILFSQPSSGLYPVVGLAAVLGAGYRTPLAAVMFVAETTGRAEFVIPALLATAVSQALMGEVSVSSGQQGERQGQLERRLEMRADAVTVRHIGTVGSDALLLDVVDHIERFDSSPAVPVLDGSYAGLLVLHDIANVILERGPDAVVADAVRDVPAVRAHDPAMAAARLMNAHDVAAVAVVDDDDQPIGIISAVSLAGLRDLGGRDD
ncbi:MAG: chloride channel protein [Acidimicrobiia bacterium]|nr:chloride channel protein [Acidimicrobiia bacterium]